MLPTISGLIACLYTVNLLNTRDILATKHDHIMNN